MEPTRSTVQTPTLSCCSGIGCAKEWLQTFNQVFLSCKGLPNTIEANTTFDNKVDDGLFCMVRVVPQQLNPYSLVVLRGGLGDCFTGHFVAMGIDADLMQQAFQWIADKPQLAFDVFCPSNVQKDEQ